MRGSNVHGPTCRVAECFTKFGNEIGEIRLGDERCRPETFLQSGLGKDLRTIQYERGEQIEGLGLEMNLATRACQLPRVEIEGEWAEANPHKRPP